VNKFLRFFKQFNVANLGIVASIAMVIAELLSLLTIILSQSYDDGLYDLFITAINVLFYLSIGRYFFRAKNFDDLRSIALALGILAIFDYVIPSVQTLINGIVNGAVGYATIVILISGAAIGILYFIFLILDLRKKLRNPYVVLIIFGSILLLINIGLSVVITLGGIETISLLSGSGLESIDIAYHVVGIISIFLSALSNLLFGLVYFLYPIVKWRRLKRGF